MSPNRSETSGQDTIYKPNMEIEEKFLSIVLNKVKELEKENAELMRELEIIKLLKDKKSLTLPLIVVISALALLGTGIISLIFSVRLTSVVLAFIGLALVLWGALLFFIRPQNYVRSDLLFSTSLSSLRIIDRMISERETSQSAIYIPVNTSQKVLSFIPFEPLMSIPKSKDILDKTFTTYPKGLVIFPPGLELANFIEKKLGVEFRKSSLEDIKGRLSKLLIEDLEISKGFEIQLVNNEAQIKLIDSIYYEFCRKLDDGSKIYSLLGCLICSAIACILAQVSGKPIKFEKSTLISEGRTIESSYNIIEV